MNHAGFCHACSGDPQKEIGSKWRLNAYRRIPYLAAIRKLTLDRASVASPFLMQVPPPTTALPPPSSGELGAQDAVRKREAERVMETEAAVALARTAVMAVKTPSKPKYDANDEEKDDQEDDTAMATPPKKVNKTLNEKKIPASPSPPSPPPAKSVKSEKGKEATKAKVELTHTASRSYWLVRVTGSSEYGSMQFSYKTSSEEKAFAEAKRHCIKVCKDLGVEVPAVARK